MIFLFIVAAVTDTVCTITATKGLVYINNESVNAFIKLLVVSDENIHSDCYQRRLREVEAYKAMRHNNIVTVIGHEEYKDNNLIFNYLYLECCLHDAFNFFFDRQSKVNTKIVVDATEKNDY